MTREAHIRRDFPALLLLALSPSWQAQSATESPQLETPKLEVAMGQKGLRSLRHGGVELLRDGEFRVISVTLQNQDGTLAQSDLNGGKVSFDEEKRQVTWSYPWGVARTAYEIMSDRVNFSISVTNSSDAILRGICLQLMELKFPQAPLGWIEHYHYLGHNLGSPSVIFADYGRGVLALRNEEIARPLLSGFPGRKSLEIRPLWVCSSNIGWLSPMLDPLLNRPIDPRGSDQYRLSLRFGPAGTSQAELGGDIYRRFAVAYPPKLIWQDRRPIAFLSLSTSEPHFHSPSNPRGWFNDPKGVDVITSGGRARFRERLLKYAEGSIRISKAMNAQGMIVWDIEGQEFPHAISYLGDPRSLPPEMQTDADEFFKKFIDAGLRIGVTIRPQRLVPAPYSDAAYSGSVLQMQTPDPAATLIEKIAYAKKRWGCTLFYVDSNGDPNVPFDALLFKRVAEAHPDVLLIPEHKNTLYYAYTAPFQSFRQGIAATPSNVRAVYPRAFSVIYSLEGPLDERRKDLLAAVNSGDILMFFGWFDNPNNAKIRSIYEELTNLRR